MNKTYLSLYILLVLLCIIVIGAFSSITHITNKYYKKYGLNINSKKVYMSEIYNDLKSCDIILYKGYRNPMISILCDCYFQHAGIVIKYSDEDVKKYNKKHNLYIVEFDPYNLSSYPLLTRIKYCGSECNIIRLNKEINKSMNDNLLQIINTQKIYHMSNFNELIKLMSWKQPILHCFRYVLYLLDKIKLANNFIKESNIINACNKLTFIYNEKLNYGYKYYKNEQIIFDLY
jgi:hypothetical protein